MHYENCHLPPSAQISNESHPPHRFSDPVKERGNALDFSTAPSPLAVPLPRFDSPLSLWEDAPTEGWISIMLPSPASDATERTCTHCGVSFGEISASGRVGCAKCYESFQATLAPLLRTLHGNTSHVGLMPRTYRERTERLARAAKLREHIQAAVGREAYEEAARLRDELKALQYQLH